MGPARRATSESAVGDEWGRDVQRAAHCQYAGPTLSLGPTPAEGLIRRAGLIHRRGTRYLCWVDEVDFEFVTLPVVGEPTVEILFTPLLDVRILLNNVERLERGCDLLLGGIVVGCVDVHVVGALVTHDVVAHESTVHDGIRVEDGSVCNVQDRVLLSLRRRWLVRCTHPHPREV